jgi:hypothetical protein
MLNNFGVSNESLTKVKLSLYTPKIGSLYIAKFRFIDRDKDHSRSDGDRTFLSLDGRGAE